MNGVRVLWLDGLPLAPQHFQEADRLAPVVASRDPRSALPPERAVEFGAQVWQVLAGTAVGRDCAEQVTLFDSVGFALEDFSALCFLQEAALETGLGSWVQLVPQAGDPKDLFGALGETELVPHEATAGC